MSHSYGDIELPDVDIIYQYNTSYYGIDHSYVMFRSQENIGEREREREKEREIQLEMILCGYKNPLSGA